MSLYDVWPKAQLHISILSLPSVQCDSGVERVKISSSTYQFVIKKVQFICLNSFNFGSADNVNPLR